MAPPSTKRSGVGFRNCTLYALDANGYPAAVDTTPYEGIHAVGAKVLTINDPAYRVIDHIGDDSLIQIDQLPATSGATAELHLGRVDDALEAAISGLLPFTVGEMNLMLAGVTDQSGFELTVGLMGYQQALDESGNRRWHAVWFPRCTIAKHESGLSDTPEDRMYNIVPSLATQHLWGAPFALGTEGTLRGQIVRGVSQYQPKLVAWKDVLGGTAGGVTFLFPTNAQAVSVNKIAVYVNGVLKTTNITKATTGITFTASYEPPAGAVIVAVYEVAKAD